MIHMTVPTSRLSMCESAGTYYNGSVLRLCYVYRRGEESLLLPPMVRVVNGRNIVIEGTHRSMFEELFSGDIVCAIMEHEDDLVRQREYRHVPETLIHAQNEIAQKNYAHAMVYHQEAAEAGVSTPADRILTTGLLNHDQVRILVKRRGRTRWKQFLSLDN